MARDIARTDAYAASRRERKKVEMLFARLRRILRLADCDYGACLARATSSTSPPPPRTSASPPG